jgi:hypothetical protein
MNSADKRKLQGVAETKGTYIPSRNAISPPPPMKIEYKINPRQDTTLRPDPKYAEREYRIFWAIAENFSVVKTIGYATQHAGDWWCPKMGCTMTEAYHLFDSPCYAYQKAIERLSTRIKTDEEKLKQLVTSPPTKVGGF